MAIRFWLLDSNVLNVDFNTNEYWLLKESIWKQRKDQSVEPNEMTMQMKTVWFDAFNAIHSYLINLEQIHYHLWVNGENSILFSLKCIHHHIYIHLHIHSYMFCMLITW